uniref:Uncharacterized protein n=1 Tax=mine drainage metagenome TaxID=410659 RepID=E6PQV4_9ZZZZ
MTYATHPAPSPAQIDIHIAGMCPDAAQPPLIDAHQGVGAGWCLEVAQWAIRHKGCDRLVTFFDLDRHVCEIGASWPFDHPEPQVEVMGLAFQLLQIALADTSAAVGDG